MKLPVCPHCGSEDVLPHESEETPHGEYSFLVIFLAAVLLAAGYFVVMVSSYIYFPSAIFILTVVAAIIINRRDRRRRHMPLADRDFVCLDCSRDFKARGRWMS